MIVLGSQTGRITMTPVTGGLRPAAPRVPVSIARVPVSIGISRSPLTLAPAGGAIPLTPAGASPSGTPPSIAVIGPSSGGSLLGMPLPSSSPITLGTFSLPQGWLVLGLIVLGVALVARG